MMRMRKPVVVLSPGPSLMQATRPPPTLRGPPVKFNLGKMLITSIDAVIMIFLIRIARHDMTKEL